MSKQKRIIILGRKVYFCKNEADYNEIRLILNVDCYIWKEEYEKVSNSSHSFEEYKKNMNKLYKAKAIKANRIILKKTGMYVSKKLLKHLIKEVSFNLKSDLDFYIRKPDLFYTDFDAWLNNLINK